MGTGGGTKSGVASALDRFRELAEARLAEPGEAQLPLLPIEAPAEEGGAVEGESAALPEKRGRGRPEGSLNKRTLALLNYFLSRYRDPLVVLGETYSRPLGELAGELMAILGVKELTWDQLIDLLKLQNQAASQALPYVHSKRPQDVKLDAPGGVTLNFNLGGDGAQTPTVHDDGTVTLAGGDFQEIEQNQRVNEKPKGESDKVELDKSC